MCGEKAAHGQSNPLQGNTIKGYPHQVVAPSLSSGESPPLDDAHLAL